MLKRSLKFLAGGVLIAVLFSACLEAFDSPALGEDPVQYDARGNRLVTISVPLESAGRAVTQKVAAANIDFYEVVFQDVDTPTIFYSAIGYKGADKAITLRIAPGNYFAVLFAGKKEDGNNAVLLAIDIGTVGGLNGDTAKVPFIIDATGKVTHTGTTIHTPISFYLTPFNLSAFTIGSNPPNLSFTGGAGIVEGRVAAAGDAPAFSYYYFPHDLGGNTITASLITGAGCVYSGTYVSAIGTVAPADISVEGVRAEVKAGGVPINPFTLVVNSPDLSTATADPFLSTLSFNFDLPPVTVTSGVTRLGFDVKVYAFDSNIENRNAVSTTKAVAWHIKNGLDTMDLDDNTDTDGNSGAGVLLVYGAIPTSLLSLPVGGF